MNGNRTSAPLPVIHRGYHPGLIGKIVGLHAETYSQWAGFGSAFERKVATELADFIGRLEHETNAIWYAGEGDHLFGSIAIDGMDLGEGLAHLRWFIVNPAHRSIGLGKQLLARAIEFVDERRFAGTHLWTLKGLEAARSLYQRTGFVLAEEYEGEQWGTRITEQRWVRKHDVSQ